MPRALPLLLLATSACTGLIGDNGATPSSASADKNVFVAAPASIRRLTTGEYASTVQAIFGVQVDAVSAFGDDAIKNGLQAIGASSATLSSVAVESIETMAFDIAEQALNNGTLDRYCKPAKADDTDCWRDLVTGLGRKVFRRPLDLDAVDRYSALGQTSASTLASIDEGRVMVVAGLLQSPDFIFRAELTEPDPENATQVRYDAYALASRVAYFLTHAPPDAELSAAADDGSILQDAVLEAQVQRLVSTPGYGVASADFFRDWLRLERLDNLGKDRTTFPLVTDTTGASMRDDITTTLKSLFDDGNGDFRDLFVSTTAFADKNLGAIYGVNVPSAMQQITIPAEQGRVGILGKPGFLALYAANVRSSPTLRGKFVRESLLCESIPPPPPNVETIVPEPDATSPTMRDRLTSHREGSCASCHNLMDPIGFTLESFDGIGVYRTKENGATIDLSGGINGTDFDALTGLAQYLHDAPEAATCATRTMYRYASGHLETDGEESMITEITASFASQGHTLPALMSAIATSKGFRYASQNEVAQ